MGKGWRDRWPEREPRPKIRKLSSEEKESCLSAMRRAIDKAPVLSSLGVQGQACRGRFYIQRGFVDDDGRSRVEWLGRISPLAHANGALLLEVEGRSGAWSEVKKGRIQHLMKIIANDAQGRFHGLGSLNLSLQKAGGLYQIAVDRMELEFFYQDSKMKCGAQEALYHYFGVPISIIAEPRQWYIYHRQPVIVEASEDRTRVLVRFIKGGLMGDFFGTVLYIVKDDHWVFFTIKPSESKSIAAAEAWIRKALWRNWI